MKTQKKIFITGITGNQGSSVAKHLLSKGHIVIGLTRNNESKKAEELQKNGVTLIQGNLDEPDTYKEHLENTDAIFLVQTLQGKESEILQGKTFIDNIDPNGKSQLVYSSVLGADLNTGVPHFDSKLEIENYLKSKDLNFTILRPASFFENHLMPQVANSIKKGKYVTPLNKGCTQQMIGVDDIGKITAKVISNSPNYKGKTISIATDEWQIGNIPNAFSEVIKKPVKYKKLPGLITRLAMGKDLSKMFKYMNKNDFRVIENIEDVRNEFEIKGNFKSWISENF